MDCNTDLADLISSRIGDDWITELSHLRQLEAYVNDNAFLNEFMAVKEKNKKRLADFILKTTGVMADTHSIFDVQVKRIHEYKHYLNDKSSKTVIAKEYSEFFEKGKNERYYPIPKPENFELYNKYQKDAKELKNVYFLGRLGDYKYYDMDKAILRALELFETLRFN